MHVSSDHVSPHAPAIERSQSDQNSNVFISQPRLALCRMCTGTPWHTIERSFSLNRSTDGPGDPCVHSVQGEARQTDEKIRILIALGVRTGLRARTKQFIEFGLKISFSPCLHIKEYQQEILYQTFAFQQLCSTVQKYSSGEVQQITHKGSIQLTILRS